MSQSSIANALAIINENIKAAHQKYCAETEKTSREPYLVAVSKTKPPELIEEAYKSGQRDFGENYVKEIVQKAAHFKETGGYDDIRWHFVGHLQRNKVNNLLGIDNLFVIQTVNDIKLADTLNKRWETKNMERKLKVFAQVNCSGEENKSGCEPKECTDLVEHIIKTCTSLQLDGLMTIGSFNHDYSTGPNPDFDCLVKCREDVCRELELNPDDLQLSMGMSNDYEQAILAGSTIVRIGSSIFGARESKVTQS